jgi:hypothetical protein
VTLTRPVEAEDRIGQSANCHLLSAPINKLYILLCFSQPCLETAPLFQTLFLAAVTTLIACKLPITPYLYHILTDGQFRSACLQQVTDPLIHLTFITRMT